MKFSKLDDKDYIVIIISSHVKTKGLGGFLSHVVPENEVLLRDGGEILEIDALLLIELSAVLSHST